MKDSKIQILKDEILGKAYELSFAFVSKEETRKLNKKYRGKDEPTDVLSFQLSKPSDKFGNGGAGEILICKEVAKQKFNKFRFGLPDYLLTTADYLLFLKIHGLFHLKGLDHGPKMESLEKKYFKKFR